MKNKDNRALVIGCVQRSLRRCLRRFRSKSVNKSNSSAAELMVNTTFHFHYAPSTHGRRDMSDGRFTRRRPKVARVTVPLARSPGDGEYFRLFKTFTAESPRLGVAVRSQRCSSPDATLSLLSQRIHSGVAACPPRSQSCRSGFAMVATSFTFPSRPRARLS